jgi:membrane associated rhomboid family serine protease
MKRPARPPFPLVTAALAVAIVGVFAVELAGNGAEFCARFGLVPARPSLGAALSSLFVHDPSAFAHVAGNVAVLLIVGTLVERAIGSWRFAALFFAGGLAGAALHVVVDPTSTVPLVGCSGALFAVLAVAAALFGPGMLAFTAVLVASNVAHAFGGPGDAGVSFGTHLGGFTLGVLLVLLGRFRGVDLRRAATA